MDNKFVVIGTAGHIDHGKSTLVRALTGTDPDRLPEEKRRSITIKLGFAQLELTPTCTAGVVDVPGHERFIREMIAGASGIDIAVLCIAADDGIMPQTREHLLVISLLGIKNLVVVLTKCDLVDADWADFIAQEISDFLADTPYNNSPIIQVACGANPNPQSAGIAQLKQTLAKIADGIIAKNQSEIFRMPIDRAFPIKGHGLVVTGTLWEGRVSVGDVIQDFSSHNLAKVKKIEVHGADQVYASKGQRVALNLSFASKHLLEAGDFIGTPDSTECVDYFNVNLNYTDIGIGAGQAAKQSNKKPLKTGEQVRFAHGTKEVMGRVLLINGAQTLEDGQSCYAQIRTNQPLAVRANDKFVVRSLSPVQVIGGGSILRTHPRRTSSLSDQEVAHLDALKSKNLQLIIQTTKQLFVKPFSINQFAQASQMSKQNAALALENLVQENQLIKIAENGIFISKPILSKIKSNIESELLKFHARDSQAAGMHIDALRLSLKTQIDEANFSQLLIYLHGAGFVELENLIVCHPKAGASAKKAFEKACAQLLEFMQQQGKTPPFLTELSQECGIEKSLLNRAVLDLEQKGLLTRINKTLTMCSSDYNKMRDDICVMLSQRPMTMSEIRTGLDISRKYAVPFLEHFDAIKLTKRQDEVRTLM